MFIIIRSLFIKLCGCIGWVKKVYIKCNLIYNFNIYFFLFGENKFLFFVYCVMLLRWYGIFFYCEGFLKKKIKNNDINYNF